MLISGFAQIRDLNALPPEKKVELAQKLIKNGGYYAAIDQLNELVQAHPDNLYYIFELAEAYFNARDYVNSEHWYEKIVNHKEKMLHKTQQLSVSTFRYAESLKYNAKYEQAREIFQLYVNENLPSPLGTHYNSWAKNEVLSCEFALNHYQHRKHADVNNLGPKINSAYSDFSPLLKNEKTLIFSSIQKDSVISANYDDLHYEHTKIYKANSEDSVWQTPTLLASVNSDFEHNGNGSFSPDGKRFYFSRCRNVEGSIRCQIYVSNISDKGMSKPKPLDGHVNHAKHSSTHPYYVKIHKSKINHIKDHISSKTVIENEYEEVLYFASDMSGSHGGMDIWHSVIDKNGKAGSPMNCGQLVNSSRDEITPYYDTDNHVLYFSSNYHFGFGGYDIFRSVGGHNNYGNPENLSIPVNSNLDDTYYKLHLNNKFKGFISSNRPGGMALKSPTCCDDIYSFQYFQPTIMVLTVIDSATNKVLKDVKIKLIVKSSRYEDIPDSLLFNTDSEAMDKLEVKTDTSLIENLPIAKKPREFYVLDAKNIILVSLEKEGYENARAMIKTNNLGQIDSLHIVRGDFYKEGEGKFETLKIIMGAKGFKKATAENVIQDVTVSTLQKEFAKATKKEKSLDTLTKQKISVVEFPLIIHFQFNMIEILEKDQPILDSLVEILKDDPKIMIDFTTHTDWIGSDDYNMKLSYRRADFIKNYISLKGISQSRIKGRGLGETVQIAPNANPDGSDNPEGRQLNRRTNVKLISGR